MPKIGLLNLMPAPVMRAAEVQWLEGLQPECSIEETVLVKFDDDPRDTQGRTRKEHLKNYTPLSEVADEGLDALIITGDNLELVDPSSPQESNLLPFSDITYYPQLAEAISWAEANTKLTVYSCLASHIALKHLFGLERDRADSKIFGVFEHDVHVQNKITAGLGQTVLSPHSRWGDIPDKLINDTDAEVLASHPSAGWLMASLERPNGQTIFLQGHPEYDRSDLKLEYLRDREFGQQVPVNYFPDDDPNSNPTFNWANDGQQILANLGRNISIL